jgi:NitT/TauT family transport system permease protein
MATGRNGRRTTPGTRSRSTVVGLQLLILGAFLAGWQWIPKVEWFQRRSKLFDPYFISSPGRVGERTWDLAVGNGDVTIWPYAIKTLQATLIGTAIGMVLGGLVGLVLSHSDLLSRVFSPFITAINAIPRIALIPIVVVVFGPSFKSSVVISVLIVFFVAFFSAWEGGRSVPSVMVQNAGLLGASTRDVLRRVRLPYVVAFTMMALPLAVTFSLLTVVTGEVLTGYAGFGRLISLSNLTSDATTTFAVALYLGVIGVLAVAIAQLVRNRVLHWWDAN